MFFSKILCFSTVSVIPPILHTYLHLYQNEKLANAGNLPKQCFSWDGGAVERKIDYCHFLSKCRPSVCEFQNYTLILNFTLLLHMLLKHFPSPYHFHFFRFLISNSLPPPDGWAEAVCEHSEQEIFSSLPRSKRNFSSFCFCIKTVRSYYKCRSSTLYPLGLNFSLKLMA